MGKGGRRDRMNYGEESALTEFAIGAFTGAVFMAAGIYIRAFRLLSLAGLAVLIVYVLVSLGVDGTIAHAGDVVEVASAHPVFFMGLAFGKFIQGLLAFPLIKRKSG